MRVIKVPISAIVGGGICVSASDGQKVYDQVRKYVINGDKVVLSFSGITRMTTAFLNAAVGQLYGEFSEIEVRKHLGEPIDYEPWHIVRLKLVVDRAKQYFKDSKSVESAFTRNSGNNYVEDI